MAREENVRDWYPEDEEETSQDVDVQRISVRRWYGVRVSGEFD